MLVLYRLCDIKSPLSAPPPIHEDNITKLNLLSLNSFIMAFAEVKPKVIFICDFCPKEVYEPILSQVPFEHEVYWTEKGINETCLMQYNLASDARFDNEDVILFAECDFLWLPQCGKKVENAIKHFGLFSPYDHLNFYLAPSIHSKKAELELFEDHHFRTVERNVMTFGMTREVFEKQFEILKRWGYLDNDVWKEMKVNGNTLWTPIPSFATHLVADFLSPGVDWEKLWQFYGEPERKTDQV